MKKHSSKDRSQSSQRPIHLPLTTTEQPTIQYLNLEKISISPSPMDTHPRSFQVGSLISTEQFERIESEVSRKADMAHQSSEPTSQQSLEEVLDQAREQELVALSQWVLSQRTQEDDPTDFILNESKISENHSQISSTEILMDRHADSLQLPIDSNNTTSTIEMIPHHPYPPINRTGHIAEHDRPYADYGHLDRKTIAQQQEFNLEPFANRKPLRSSRKSLAILSCTNVSKARVYEEIKKIFTVDNLQYICIGEDINDFNQQRQLNIQIILKKTVDLRKPFLNAVTETECNYHVTNNDVAWNEYIKQNRNFIEYNEFKSSRIRAIKQWPTTTTTTDTTSTHTVPVGENPMASLATRRIQKEDHNEIFRHASELAKINVHEAMDHIREQLPERFLSRGLWYLRAFNYIHLNAQHEAARQATLVKKHIWPHSFPNCTTKLRQVIDDWIQNEFIRTAHAKCLILIGESEVGKTSFALSLPGRVNYYQGQWSLDRWDEYARYSVYDHIRWDDFEKYGYPDRKQLLTQPKEKILARDRGRKLQLIHVRQPAIVLLNPNEAGSLLSQSGTKKQKESKAFWEDHAIIYVMDSHEYFYRRVRTRRDATPPDHQSSNYSWISSAEERLGEPDEFEKMYENYQKAHTQEQQQQP